jgi:hypothetical protein
MQPLIVKSADSFTKISFRQAKRFLKPFAFAKRVLRATARINSSWFFYVVGIFYIFEK